MQNKTFAKEYYVLHVATAANWISLWQQVQ